MMTPRDCATRAEEILMQVESDVALPSAQAALANAWVSLGQLKIKLENYTESDDLVRDILS